jgi:hypothetical protein
MQWTSLGLFSYLLGSHSARAPKECPPASLARAVDMVYGSKMGMAARWRHAH